MRETGSRRGFVPISLLLMLPGCVGLVSSAVPRPLRAQETEALALLEEAGARYKAIRGFCAEFEQELSVPLLRQTTYSKGTLCEQQPDLFSMRFSDPEGDAIVADGQFFWVYYPSTDPHQVLQFSMEGQPGAIDFNREFLEDPADKYELEYLGTDTVGGEPTEVISAKPRDPGPFEEARIWLDPEKSMIRKVRITMENGSVRTVTLSRIQLDPPPDPERFRFTPPPGAQVIRRGSG